MLSKTLIGKNIRSARQEKRLSQAKLSELAGLTPSLLSNYETGKSLPGLDTLSRIADCLDVSMDWLCYGDESQRVVASAKNEGRLIANCIYELWKRNVLLLDNTNGRLSSINPGDLPTVSVDHYASDVIELLAMLDIFRSRETSFDNPDLYIEQVLDSAAKQINAGCH